MRSGFTTGTCAAVAARANMQALALGAFPQMCQIMTPKGVLAVMEICDGVLEEGYACCGVHKDSGDDPDVTNGTWVGTAIFAKNGNPTFESLWERVALEGYLYRAYAGEVWIGILGGKGIGRATKAGLSCPIGHAAINPIPREMLARAVADGVRDFFYRQGEPDFAESEAAVQAVEAKESFLRQLLEEKERLFVAEVRIPEGEHLAQKTFNPNLGIVGGLSVLGTSGIVEPMSEDALRETIRLELHMKAVEGRQRLILTPGNYGETFLKEAYSLSLKEAVKCSNFVGDAFCMAEEEGYEAVLFVGHIGKLIKVSLGVMNTHSRYGDRRMEGFLEAVQSDWKRQPRARQCKKEQEILEKLRCANTSEEALSCLEKEGILEPVMNEIVLRIQKQLQEHLRKEQPSFKQTRMKVEVLVFSSRMGLLAKTAGAEALIGQIQEESQKSQGETGAEKSL